MATHVALLRGINVGGNNKLPMADLRQIAASLGHSDVATYIQSGNLLFTARGGASTSELAAGLAGAITEATGLRIGVVVLARDELAQVIRDNPYPDEPNPKFVHAVFLPEPPGPEAAEEVAEAVARASRAGSQDTAQFAGSTLFLHTPGGFGRSELAKILLNRSSGRSAAGTARNWSTVTKLATLCGA
jgi:uncharacterized protein (DUF1697 family)